MKTHLIQKLRYLLNNDINEVYASISIRTLFSSMVSIFIPIFLFISGFPLYLIPLFYLVRAVAGIPLCKASEILSGIFKPPILIAISSVIFSASLMGINYISMDAAVIAILAVGFEASDLLFWVPFHNIFAATSSRRKMDKEFGTWQSLASFAPLVSPAIAAIIIILFGYNMLFALASAGMLISAVPLFFIKHQPNIKPRMNSIAQTSTKFLAEGVRVDGLNVYWPILIFIVLGSIEALGEIFTVTSLSAAVAMLLIGYVDNDKLHELLKKIGGALHSTTIFIRVFMNNFAAILITMIGATVTNSALVSPYFVEFYKEIKRDDAVLMRREVDLRKGRIIANILFLVLLWIFPQSMLFTIFFLAISPASIIMASSKY